MARPSIEIDEKKLKSLMRLKPTLEDTAAFFECSGRTIERFIRENFEITFFEFRERYMVHTRLNIVRKAIQKAENGDNVMLIFCLKNLCGWRDKAEGEEQKVIVNNFTSKSDEELDQRIGELTQEIQGRV